MKRSLQMIGLAAGLVALAGCKGGKQSRVDSKESQVVSAGKVQTDDIEIAVRELCDKVSKHYAQGWPAYIIKTDDGKPQIRVGFIKNKTTTRFEMEMMRGEIYNALVNQGIFYVVGQSDDSATIEDERDYSGAQMGKEVDPTLEDTNGFVLNCEILSDVDEGETESGDTVRQHTYMFDMRFVDVAKKRIVINHRAKLRKQKEL